jgi:hypothetical protein
MQGGGREREDIGKSIHTRTFAEVFTGTNENDGLWSWLDEFLIQTDSW